LRDDKGRQDRSGSFVSSPARDNAGGVFHVWSLAMTNNSIRFRPAEPADAVAISDIVRAAYAKWVADGRIVGMIETMLADDHLWIENVCVAPQAQGRGIGRLLLERAEQKALEAGRSELRLLTNGAFEANVSLYKSQGYKIDREEPFMGGMTVYMSKRLTR
jgi:ribosomal protein S18 acetylase RimI-like enzyme